MVWHTRSWIGTVSGVATGTALNKAMETILEGIRLGRYPRGTALPSERVLSAQFGLARMTVRAALKQLETMGEVSASPQRGWYVRQLMVGEAPSTLQSFTEMAAERGLRAGSRVISREVRPAHLEEAEDLRIAPTAPVIAIRRLRTMDELPITVEDLVLPMSRVGWLADVDLEDASLYVLLAQHGIHLDHSQYTVTAVNAAPDIAAMLGLPAGAAILVADEITYARGEVAIIRGRNRYRGDAYQFVAQLVRPPGA